MAGIKGQPTPKPSDVSAPVPDTGASASALDSFMAEESKLNEFMAAEAAPTELPEDTGPEPMLTPGGTAEAVVQTTADWAPTIVGTAGAIAGTTMGGPVGGIALAGLGGAAGTGYKQWIEQNILGKAPADPNAQLKEAGQNALLEGAGQAAGLGMGKAAGALGKTKFGAAIAEKVGQVAEAPLKYIRESINDGVAKLEEPLLKFIAERSTPMNTEAAGTAAKELLKKDISGKYGTFIKAYADLDAIAKTIPVEDKVRHKFTEGLKSWSLDNHGGDNYKMIRKFADDINAANGGAQIDDVIKQIGDSKRMAMKNGATGQAKVLGELQDKANDFLEGETTKLAARIQAGKGSPQELAYIQQLAQQAGEPDAAKYAKSLTSDYLKGKDTVKKEYAMFRDFLEDVGEQTKTKAGRTGPSAFMQNLEDVPSEKLIERMFDPKNAAALRRMQKATPEVYDTVVKSKLSQIVQKASPDGSLDLGAFRKEVYKLPESTRNMLMSPAELKQMNLVVDNPRVKALKGMQEQGENFMLKWAERIVGATQSVGGKAAADTTKALQASPLLRQAVGRPAAGLGAAFLPQSEEPPQ